MEDPRNINTRIDRVSMEWFDRLGIMLEKYSKLIDGTPDQIIQHNITTQHIDQQVLFLQDSIRQTLSEMDIETSLRFMEILDQKMSKAKMPTEREREAELRLADVKILNQTINEKLNGDSE